MSASSAHAFAAPATSVAWLLGGYGLPQTADPTASALVWEGGSRTYAELRSDALALATAFRDRGLRRGDRVACHLFNRGETFEIYFACAFAGLTLVPANFRSTSAELSEILEDVDARLLFTEDELADTAQAAVAELEPSPQLVQLGAGESGAEYERLLQNTPLPGPYEHTDPHLILFSSGTTGKPKGVQLTHQNIVNYSLQQAVVYPRYSREMTMLVVPTMFNTGGINELVLPTFLVGGRVCILPSRKWSAERMAGYIHRWQVTHTCLFPTMFGPMLDADAVSPLPLESVEVVITGGEPCPPETIRRFRDRWPEKELIDAYGLTEGGLVTLANTNDMDRKPGSVGRAAQAQSFKIVTPDGELAVPGETGEIWTASPTVIPGYWNAPELTEQALVDGWLRTGDLGHVDEDGYLYIDGRVRDMIISKGQNVFPAEIEAVLREHDAIRECAVVGIPDAEFGEAVCAVIVLRPDHTLTESEVVTFVRDRIASYKKPRHVVFQDSLPMSVNNKVLKRELARDVAAALSTAH